MPGYLKHAASHLLSTALREVRCPKEDTAALTVTVQTYLEGYNKNNVQLGYVAEAGSAVPLYWDHTAILVHTLDGVIGDTLYCAVMRAALRRDVCAVRQLWETTARGGNHGEKRLPAPRHGFGARMASQSDKQFARCLPSPGSAQRVTLHAHTGVMELSLLPKGDASVCMLRRLRPCSAQWPTLGTPLSPTCSALRPTVSPEVSRATA